MVGHSFSTHRTAATAETRQKILQGAFRALSRKGYEHTTVKDIAEEAGVAQGLVNYHFKSKQGLVLAVLAMCCAEMQVSGRDDAIAGAIDAFEQFKAMLRTHRDVHQLYVQLIGVGLHDAEVSAGILEDMRQRRGNVEAIAREVLAQSGQPTELAPAVAAAVWGGTLGIMIQTLIDREFDTDAAVDALAAMSIAAANHPEYLARRG